MKIILAENSFTGAYGSFSIFFDEIECALKRMNHEVFRAYNVRDLESVYNHHAVDFSLSIGKYNFFSDDQLLCEKYRTPHYQWIIDNPMKMPDFTGENFVPIFIDREFIEMYDNPPKNYLCLPLGIEINESEEDPADNNRVNGIIFAGQVKSIDALKDEIMQSRQLNIIEKFIKLAAENLDASFILQYKKFLADNEPYDEEEFFRLANSYLRSMKRVTILQRINKFPLILAGDIFEKSLLQKNNVIHLGKVSYENLHEIFSHYTHVLHISPNYSACIHDRILRGVKAGCNVVADGGEVLRKIFGGALTYFDYRTFNGEIPNVSHKSLTKAREILKCFSWERVLLSIIGHYRKLRRQHDRS